MRGRQIGRVIDRVGIHAVAARRLERDERVAELHRRRTDSRGRRSTAPSSARPARSPAALGAIFLSTFAIRIAQRVAARGRRAPPVFHPPARGRRQPSELAAIARPREAQRLRRIERMRVVVACRAPAARPSARRSWPAGRRSCSRRAASRAAGASRLAGRIEPDGVARPATPSTTSWSGRRPRASRRGVRQTTAAAPGARDAGNARDPIGVRRVEAWRVLRAILEGQRHGDDASVELGNRDVDRRVERRQPAAATLPTPRAACRS